MAAQRMKRAGLTLAIVAVAVLVGAMLGRAQSVFPVRFDDSVEGPVVVSVSAVSADAFRLIPLDEPPVTCDAAHQGFAYLQNDVGSVDTVWERQVCICIAYDATGPQWWSHTVQCADLLN